MTRGAAPPQNSPIAHTKLYYSISEAARITGVKPHRLRYWESLSLIRPSRRAGNKRLFSGATIERIREIKRMLNEGMTLRGARSHLGVKPPTSVLRELREVHDLVRELRESLSD